MPVGRGTLFTPPPLPMGILYSPQFRLHQETKMVAHQNERFLVGNDRELEITKFELAGLTLD